MHVAGFEFTKRKFKQTYGENLPVWALLASGSMGGVRPVVNLILILTQISRQISYWLACYPLGLYLLRGDSLALRRAWNANDAILPDVVKSRIQLRNTPPTGTPVQYVWRELKSIVHESGP